MGKSKMKLPFLSQSKSLDTYLSSSQTWPFPSCGNIKTLSFRAKDDTFTTFNSAFLEAQVTPPESFFTISNSSRSFSTLSEDSGDPVESVIRGLRSDRLFFEPERSSNLLLRKQAEKEVEEQEQEEEKFEEDKNEVVYKESELFSMDSNNPYEDFRKSMEEMIEAHGLKDWQGLEELLECYLKINGKNTHGYIVGAFIDLLVSLSFDTSTSSTSTTTNYTTTSSSYSNYSSPSSPLSLPSSSLTTPCLSSILDHDDGDRDDHDVVDNDHVSS